MEEYRGQRIERRPPGFEFTPVLLGKITTYVVLAPGERPAPFAFMYSFLVTGEPEADEGHLEAEAMRVIRLAIDGGQASPVGPDRTYEWDGERWLPVSKPLWWVTPVSAASIGR